MSINKNKKGSVKRKNSTPSAQQGSGAQTAGGTKTDKRAQADKRAGDTTPDTKPSQTTKTSHPTKSRKSQMTKKSRFLRSLRSNLFFILVPLAMLFLEYNLRFTHFTESAPRSNLFVILFSGSIGLIAAVICSIFSKKINRVLFSIFLSLVTLIFIVQIIYFQIFKTFTTLFSATTGAGGIMGFWRDILEGMKITAIPLLICLVPLIAWFVFGKRIVPQFKPLVKIAIPLVLAIAMWITGVQVAMHTDSSTTGPKYLYTEFFHPELATRQFGLLTMTRLDMKNLMFGMSAEVEYDPNVTGGLPTIETSRPTSAPSPTPEVPEPTTADPTVTPTPSPSPTPIVYEENILPIDFAALAEETDDKTLKNMHEYFGSQVPSKQNEYTGMFKDKNLIWICAEGFSPMALHPELTPTLNRLSSEGFVFENFYNPIWYVSTSDGEYTTCTGLLPKGGVWSFFRSGSNYMPFTFGHQFSKLGYSVNAYHNHTYDYYNRDVSHPNMGYDYKGIGNGLVMEKAWPRSDLEMMEKTIDEYIQNERFHAYYMTVSGHLMYNFSGNAMAAKNKDKVEDLPWSTGPKAYIACNLELEYAMAYLLERLEEEGVLDDTVIVLSNDHYPYGLEQAEMDEITGHKMDTEFEIYESTLILWNSAMEETITVTKPASPIDILPTLSNLFGIPYDSRLFIGQDILSNSPGLVMFDNRSWISDYGRFNATKNVFLPNEGLELPEDYADIVNQQVKYKFEFSAKILDKDYYNVVLKDLPDWAKAP